MNPLILRLIPLAVSAACGFAIAWGNQGLRLTSAEHEFVEYKQEQVRIVQEQRDAANRQREEADKRYSDARSSLEKEIQAGDVFRRCVLAGRCGVPRSPSGVCESTSRRAGAGLSAPRRVDEAGQASISASREPSAENVCEGLANDAAEVQLQLNQLQDDITKQPNYKE